MIQITKDLWIGGVSDDKDKVTEAGIEHVINVAFDLTWYDYRNHWPETGYTKIGLMDGPGNELGMYYAAVMVLADKLKHGSVILVCHSGSRSLAVALMYLNSTNNCGWDTWMNMLSERIEGNLPVPHEAHRDAFDKLNWKFLAEIIK